MFDPIWHYGRNGHCRAPKSHGKGRARQSLPGKDPAGKAVFAVRRAKIARQSLCRAT
jgi:hypothetical protein